jgi:hypothetical protein
MNLRRDKPGTELPTQTPPEPTVPEVIAGLQIDNAPFPSVVLVFRNDVVGFAHNG